MGSLTVTALVVPHAREPWYPTYAWRLQAEEEKDKNYVRRERRYGSFSRSIALPAGVDPKSIEATTKDGVLEVTIPLPREAKKERVTITPSSAS